MNKEIKEVLLARGVDIVRFVDISDLPTHQTQGYKNAIVFCMALSKNFIKDVYHQVPISTDEDEFLEKDKKVNELAEWLASYIEQNGYCAYAQSESNHLNNGNFDEKSKTTILPHKTIARVSGLGFIGKNNLLITEAYGCGFCMCTVLTDAPLVTENNPIIEQKCGDCDICRKICPGQAIQGKKWFESGSREDIVDVFKCRCALKCMINCPWTLKYASR